MTTIMEEIQAAALDRTVPVTDILRRVKLVASKLGLTDALEWVNDELNGYHQKELKEIPPYRVSSGRLMENSRFHGQRLAYGDPESIAAMSVVVLNEPIASVEASIRAEGDRIVMPIDFELSKALAASGIKGSYEVHLNKSVLVSIADSVRTMVLDWAIELEREGINGEGVSFSSAEKERAERVSSTVQIINHGYIHQGDNSGHLSRVNVASQDSSSNSSSETVFSSVQNEIAQRITDEAVRDELHRLLKDMQATQGTPQYKEHYSKFMEAAAHHMTVLAPFLPALSTFLP